MQDPTAEDAIRKFVLFVGGIKVPMTKVELRTIFENYGEPLLGEVGAAHRGYVFVELRTTEARAIQAGLNYFGAIYSSVPRGLGTAATMFARLF